MKKLRSAIIHKLGGITFDDVASNVGAIKDYWKHECVHTSVYVNPDHYSEKYAESIEKEIAHKLAEIMLEFGYIAFTDRRASDGDVEVMGRTHVLAIKQPLPCHMPSRLRFVKGEKS